MDGSGEARDEVPVGDDALPVAVEQQSYQLAVRVQRGRAAVAAGGVERRQEVDRQGTELGRCVRPEMLRPDRVDHGLGRIERNLAGALLHDPLGGGEGGVRDRVARPVSLDGAVRDPKRAVGVRVDRLATALLPGDQRLHELRASGLELSFQRLGLLLDRHLVVEQARRKADERILARIHDAAIRIHQPDPGLEIRESRRGVHLPELRVEPGLVDPAVLDPEPAVERLDVL